VTGHHDLLTTNAIPVSSCLNYPGPGDKCVGRYALMSIGLPTVAAESVDHPDETSIQIPMTGAESEGLLPLLSSIIPWPEASAIALWRLIT